jgi:hypothetical protein
MPSHFFVMTQRRLPRATMRSQQPNDAHDYHKAVWFDRTQSSAAPIHDLIAVSGIRKVSENMTAV